MSLKMGAYPVSPAKYGGAISAFDHPSAPMGLVAVKGSTGGGMLGGDAVDGDLFRQFARLPPGTFVDSADVPFSQPGREALRHPVLGTIAKRADAGGVQVVVMRMADEHVVDGGQVFEEDARRFDAAVLAEGDRLTIAEDGIGEDVDASMLKEEGGVAYPGKANAAFVEGLGGVPVAMDAAFLFRVWGGAQNRCRFFGREAQLPAQHAGDVVFCVRVGVAKPGSTDAFQHKRPGRIL